MIGSIFLFSWLSVTCVDYAWTAKLRNKCINDSFDNLKNNDFFVFEENKENIYHSLKLYAKYKKGLDETDNIIMYLSSFPILNLAILKKLIDNDYKNYFEDLSSYVLEEEFLKRNHIMTNKEYDDKYSSKIIYKKSDDNLMTENSAIFSNNKIKKRVLKK